MRWISLVVSGVSLLAVTQLAQAGLEDEDRVRLEADAHAVTVELFETLAGRLQEAMQEDGPVAAISVCRDDAPAIKTRLSLEKGWQVSRVGTRVRNPLLGTPDAWEREVLDEFERQRADGKAVPELNHSEVVSEGDQRYFRYMRGIGVQGNCLLCHGTDEQIPEPVRDVLDDRYPHDAAWGYEVGDLRGAFTVKIPLKDSKQ
ncbi:DUF3365 domain-containing protein [Gammaproteobacteria bacterium AB-CW1]|uniref:DUF3365 domain-containing protein n=1 Tax=Natronospira elongata TaxID=3110268 RepID=A0AAP6JEN2_9GAMM|nr:DUF3365 domain-containing protein [Gammaproteobacteria bacterium AB-CW1]